MGTERSQPRFGYSFIEDDPYFAGRDEAHRAVYSSGSEGEVRHAVQVLSVARGAPIPPRVTTPPLPNSSIEDDLYFAGRAEAHRAVYSSGSEGEVRHAVQVLSVARGAPIPPRVPTPPLPTRRPAYHRTYAPAPMPPSVPAAGSGRDPILAALEQERALNAAGNRAIRTEVAQLQQEIDATERFIAQINAEKRAADLEAARAAAEAKHAEQIRAAQEAAAALEKARAEWGRERESLEAQNENLRKEVAKKQKEELDLAKLLGAVLHNEKENAKAAAEAERAAEQAAKQAAKIKSLETDLKNEQKLADMQAIAFIKKNDELERMKKILKEAEQAARRRAQTELKAAERRAQKAEEELHQRDQEALPAEKAALAHKPDLDTRRRPATEESRELHNSHTQPNLGGRTAKRDGILLHRGMQRSGTVINLHTSEGKGTRPR